MITTTTQKEGCFAAVVDTSEVNRHIPTGAVAIIDPNDHELRRGALYAIREDGAFHIRVYQSDPIERFEPDSYDGGHRTLFEMGRIELIGRIIGSYRPHS